MEFTKDQLYYQIKEKNPYLNHDDIIRIQQKIKNKLSERKKSNINSQFQKEQNLRNIPCRNPNNNYIPRVEQPRFQEKIHRNQLEDSYQDFYKQRNEYNQQEYVNSIRRTGTVNPEGIFQNNEHKRNLMNQHIQENNSERNTNTFEKTDLILNDNNIDEQLKIFGLLSNYSMNELKNSYKKLTLQHHPDRGGDIQTFRIITNIFNNLSTKYQERQSDKQFNQLKSDFNKYTEEREKTINTQIDSDKFNLEVFNKVYQDNRLETSNDNGYGDWKTTDTSESNQKTLSKFELNSFNSSFKQQKKKNQQNQQIIEYNEPTPSNRGTGMSYSEIEDRSINDFSSEPDSNLKFTDYKQAHSNNNLIDIDKIKIREYKNVDDLENERSNISYKMTPEQLEKYNIQKRQEQIKEEQRLQSVRRQDDQYEQHFNRMNKLLLNSFHS